MAKPTCAKCSAVATVAGMCGKCWRNSRSEPTACPETLRTPPAEDRVETRVEIPGPAETPQQRVETRTETPCEAPGCVEMVQQSGKGRRRKFCSVACRDRTYRAKP